MAVTKRSQRATQTVATPAQSKGFWSRLPGAARVAVLVGAGLALGLFVGHRGGLMARGGARNDMGVGGPGGFRMMGGLNGGPRGGRHAGFDGTVSSVSGNSVTITAANGTSVTVTLPAASTVLTQHTGSVQDLTTGSTVHVDLVPGTTDQATSVIVTK